MDENLIKVGTYKIEFNEILGIDISELDIYQSSGLKKHMLKSRHEKCLKYIECISEIINDPDYIGVNPNENGADSIELIKRYEDNVLIGIKLDRDNDYLYVATMHDIQESKIQRRLHSGRIKKYC